VQQFGREGSDESFELMSRWRPTVTTVISLAGLGLSVFLTWAHYFDQAAITNSCKLAGGGSGIVNCGLVTTSPQSVVFGIPVAVYGLGFFVVMTVLCLPIAWRSTSIWLARARLGLNIVGMGFVLYLVSVEFLQLHHICLYCTGVHLLQFALFLLVVTGWNDTGYAWATFDEAEQSEDGPGDAAAIPGPTAPRPRRSIAAGR
jgi:uncharacterized membrane protein